MSRIIAGEAKGRRIKVPEAGTRPTSDRAREGLFSSLQTRFGLADQVVADLFAGSGALGLEAASRGARSVTLVENNPHAISIIKDNARVVGKGLAPGAIKIVESKVSAFVASAPRQHFSMILADPPYDLSDEAVNEMVQALVPLLQDQAVLVVERHKDSAQTVWPDGFVPTGQKLKKRTFGIARFDMAVFKQSQLEKE